MKNHVLSAMLLMIVAHAPLWAADPAKPADTPDKTEKKPAAKVPDLAVTRFVINTEKVDRDRSILLIRVENIGTAPSVRTGIIVDCRLPDKENQHCPGTAPPPRFALPAMAIGEKRDFTLPLRRFLPAIGKKERHELRARADTAIRNQDSNAFNNSKKIDLVY